MGAAWHEERRWDYFFTAKYLTRILYFRISLTKLHFPPPPHTHIPLFSTHPYILRFWWIVYIMLMYSFICINLHFWSFQWVASISVSVYCKNIIFPWIQMISFLMKKSGSFSCDLPFSVKCTIKKILYLWSVIQSNSL